MSIRLRLTLLYSAILAVTLIASGLALYTAVSEITFASARAALDAEAASYAVGVHIEPDPDRGNQPHAIVPPAVKASRDYVQVRLSNGKSLYRSPALTELRYSLPLDAATRGRLRGRSPSAAPIQSTVTVSGTHLLVDTLPLLAFAPPQGQPGQGTPYQGQGNASHGAPNQGSTHQATPPVSQSGQRGQGGQGTPPQGTFGGIVQVATALQPTDQTLGVLRVALLGGVPVVILLAFGAGWLLAGTALHPINRITQTAAAIGATQDFARRVAYAGPPDEVGRLAHTVNAMLARLQDAYQAQRRFVGDASHELRTPLTTIRGNLGLLQRDPPIAETDRVAVLADLVSESERLSRLVADLLTLARSDAGRPLRREPVQLRPLLAGLLRRLTAAEPGRAIALKGPADATALGDPDALTQVVLILLDNALKFTPEDGTVSVSVAIHSAEVAIAVRDTGPGIAPEALPHLFERFYQGDAARAGGGTGLGLAIAQALTEGQGGTIRVESQVGQGSTFTVALPRATAGASPSPEARPTSSRTADHV